MPTLNQVHHDSILQNLTIAYDNQDYIGSRIGQIIPVKKDSDYYYVFDKASQLRSTAGYRAPGTSSNRDDFALSEVKYQCREIAQSTTLPDEIVAGADEVLDYEMEATDFTTKKVMLLYETIVEAKLMTTANWTNSVTPTVKWENYNDSDPISDIDSAISYCKTGNGYIPNTMVISDNVLDILKRHPVVKAILSNDTMRIVTLNDLRAIFNIPNIYVGTANINTAEQGLTGSYSPIWNKDCWVGYVAPTAGKKQASALYTFAWDYTGSPAGELIGIGGVRKWRDENIHSTVVESYRNFDTKITGSDLGCPIVDCIS